MEYIKEFFTNIFTNISVPALPLHVWLGLFALIVLAILLVWLSLAMAAAEGAVPRVTRASLNNLMIEAQTHDDEISAIVRMRKIARIHRVKKLIADRYATSGACAFVRVLCNVLDGVLIAALVAFFWRSSLDNSYCWRCGFCNCCSDFYACAPALCGCCAACCKVDATFAHCVDCCCD